MLGNLRLNSWVGLNKDHHLFDAKGELTEEAKQASTEFNRNILRSHSVGFGPALNPKLVRLSMVIRLNTLLTGRAGVQPYVAELYAAFSEQRHYTGSSGARFHWDADITLASHIRRNHDG